MKLWRIPLAGALVGLLLVVGYYFLVYQPRADAIAQIGADAEQLRAQQAELTGEIAALEDVEEREDEFRTAARRLVELIPSELAQPTVLTQLQEAAEAAGVTLDSVTFGGPIVPEGAPESGIAGMALVEMAVTVVAEGAYLQLTDLLRRVELEVERAVLVGDVALAEAETGLPQLRGTWNGRVYALLPADHPLLRDLTAPPPEAPAETPAETPGETSPPEGAT